MSYSVAASHSVGKFATDKIFGAAALAAKAVAQFGKENVTNATIGGARNVSYKAGDHRGARQEGIIQAQADGSFKLVRDFRPYPANVFDAKLA